jgi:signal transduction histidine kinase
MSESNHPQEKILVVDDTPTNINILFHTLEQRGFKVLVAGNGESAVDRAKIASPDLILLDIMMPGIDGFETCRRLKNDDATRDIPVVFMTALTETVDKIKGFSLGAVDYITKPFQVEEVLARIDTHLTIERQRRELAALNSRLEEINASKDKFFSIVSHDLKNVFMYIPQLSDMLLENFETLSEEERREIVTRIRGDAKNTQNLFENLLHWSRLQVGSAKISPQAVELAPIVEKTRSLFEEIARGKGVRIETNAPAGVVAYADDNLLFTVLRNLVSNAVKFTERDGVVEVSATKEGEFVEIVVKDDGVGMTEKTLGNLFKIEHARSSAGTASEQGTGLGLILVKEMVGKSEGELSVESELGKGATFAVRLPASA